MKKKGLICGLISCMLALFTTAIATVKVDTASADASTVYPFETGANAFEYGVEVTVPNTDWSTVYYSPDTAFQEVFQFQGIENGGVLALQVSTEQAVSIYMTAWDGAAQYGYAWGSAWFMYEDGTVIEVYSNGAGIAIPAYASGALILPTNGFGLSSWSNVTLIMPNFHVTYAGQKVELGALGYALDYTLAGMTYLTSLNDQSRWIINGGDFSSIIETKAETTTYPFATDKNAFANGRSWSVTADVAWSTIYYNCNGTQSLDGQNGYLALQIEALTTLYLHVSVFDGASQVWFTDFSYFVNENGTIDKLPCYTNIIKIAQGSKGMLVLPLKGFVSSTFNWATTTIVTLDSNVASFGAQSAKLGTMGYYASKTSQMQAYTALENALIQTNGTGTLEVIPYIEDQVKNDMRKGDNAFAYGAVWSGVQQTQEGAWPKVVVDFDSAVAMDQTNGIIAVQMDIACENGFLFLPSIWDGAGESYLLGGAAFISEDGVVTNYENTNGNLYLPAGKGVLVMKVADFANNTNLQAVTNIVITVNSAYAYNFALTIGEIGYYANATDTMQKILTLDKIDDFNQYHLAGDGALNYVRDAELAKQTVTVKFANEAGERLSTQDVFYYGTLTQPADPTKEIAGYQATFLGWYNGDQKWNFDTPVLKEIVLVAKFEVSIINYTVTFVADGATVDTATYNVENSTITAPAVPAKEGYTGAWEAYTLTTGDVTVNAVYTAINYTVTFVADGTTVDTATYTVANTAITAPAVPEKTGYTGAWEAYTLTTGDVTVNAVYTAIEYTVTFVADGTTVDTATYTVENKEITAPEVPAKEGYTGVWEAYELTTGDITVNAVYTVVETPDDGSNSDKPSIELPEIADKVLGKFGCSNAIGGVSATFALLVVAGILLKKKED